MLFPVSHWGTGGALQAVKLTVPPSFIPSDQSYVLFIVNIADARIQAQSSFMNALLSGAVNVDAYNTALTPLSRGVVINAAKTQGLIYVAYENASSAVTNDLWLVASSRLTDYAVTAPLGRNAAFSKCDYIYYIGFDGDPTAGAPQLTDLTGNGYNNTVDAGASIVQTTLGYGLPAYTHNGSTTRNYSNVNNAIATLQGGVIAFTIRINSLIAVTAGIGIQFGYGGSGATAIPGFFWLGKSRRDGLFGNSNTHLEYRQRTEGFTTQSAQGTVLSLANGQTYHVYMRNGASGDGNKIYIDGSLQTLVDLSGTNFERWFDNIDVEAVGTPRVSNANLYIGGSWGAAPGVPGAPPSDDTIAGFGIKSEPLSVNLAAIESANILDGGNFFDTVTAEIFNP